jgi:hypothetical protein
MAQQPLIHLGSLVGGVVIADQVQVQVGGHGAVDRFQKMQGLLVAVTAVMFGAH